MNDKLMLLEKLQPNPTMVVKNRRHLRVKNVKADGDRSSTP